MNNIVEELVVLGVDPGFASTGLSVVCYSKGGYEILGTKLITTKKENKKVRTNLRVSVDDQRRYYEIYKELTEFAKPYSLSAIAVETYTVAGARAGNAWKAAVVYGGITFWALCNEIYLSPFMPIDLKTRFCTTEDSSKKAVENSLIKEVIGFEKEIKKYPKTKTEHISDATGHAILLLEEINKNRIMFRL